MDAGGGNAAAEPLDLPALLTRAWIGDMIGAMVVAPPLLALRARPPRPDRAVLVEGALQAGLAVLVLGLLFHLPVAVEWQVIDLLVLPAIWAAARFGVGGAMMINVVLQAGLVIGFVTVMHDADGLTAYQLRMLILTLSTLFLGVAVTGRRRAEDGLRRRQDQLESCARLSLAGEMAAALAHEINQPLSAALTYARTAGRLLDSGAADPARLRAALAGAASQTERAGAIVRSLREFIGRGELDRRRHDLPVLVREALALVDAERQRAGIRVEVALARGLPPLLVDAVQVQQVLVNLLRNAIEALDDEAAAPGATPGGGRRLLTVTAWREPGGLVAVEVADSGPGLDPELAGRLFQPFATTKAAGMGLGLAICRTIIEAHGGRLWLAGDSPRGCAFRFTLPLAEQGGGG
ncbi:sensor histidine kinase [Phaeospirillum tilakii]|uniref:histidine kinase n=1 Tax=Phaeospirillum tilakii TaxID=741673 RepID=A0ABW5C9Y2_9PROT